MIERTRPDVLIGMPTFIYHVLQQAVAEKRDWPDIKRIVLGGEKVPPGLRGKLRALCSQLGSLGVHVISTYGFTEAKMAFPECPTMPHEGASGFHLYPDLALVEIVNPKTGDPVPPGEPGEIVFTPLDARGTVVLRYRTGDIAEGGLTWEACPHCGRRCPRLVGPISRVSERRMLNLDKLKGTLVDFNVLEHLLDDQRGIAAWQIELRKRNDDPLECDEVILHVAARIRNQRGIDPRANRTPLPRRHRTEAQRDLLPFPAGHAGAARHRTPAQGGKNCRSSRQNRPGTPPAAASEHRTTRTRMKSRESLVIVAGVRTPFCRAGTALAGLDAVELGRAAVTGLLTKTGHRSRAGRRNHLRLRRPAGAAPRTSPASSPCAPAFPRSAPP